MLFRQDDSPALYYPVGEVVEREKRRRLRLLLLCSPVPFWAGRQACAKKKHRKPRSRQVEIPPAHLGGFVLFFVFPPHTLLARSSFCFFPLFSRPHKKNPPHLTPPLLRPRAPQAQTRVPPKNVVREFLLLKEVDLYIHTYRE